MDRRGVKARPCKVFDDYMYGFVSANATEFATMDHVTDEGCR